MNATYPELAALLVALCKQQTGWFPRTMHIEHRDYKLYVRAACRPNYESTHNTHSVRTLEIGQINVTTPNTGIGGKILNTFEQVAKDQGRAIYVENVFNKALDHLCTTRKYKPINNNDGIAIVSYFKDLGNANPAIASAA